MVVAPRPVVCALVLGMVVGLPATGQAMGGGSSAGEALPGLARQLAQARVEYDQAARDYQNATAELARQRRAAEEKFESSQKYVDASRGVDDSAAAYNARRREVVADLLKNDDRYQQLDAQRRAVDVAIDNARSRSGTRSPDVVAQLVSKKAEIAAEMKGIEDREMNKAGANSLREKWVGNARELADLKTRHRSEAENSEELKPIQDRIRNSRAALDRATANLAAASAAYEQTYAQYADQQAQQEYYRRHYAPPFTWYPTYGDGYYYPGPGWGYWR